jgi:hypothetical protein
MGFLLAEETTWQTDDKIGRRALRLLRSAMRKLSARGDYECEHYVSAKIIVGDSYFSQGEFGLAIAEYEEASLILSKLDLAERCTVPKQLSNKLKKARKLLSEQG